MNLNKEQLKTPPKQSQPLQFQFQPLINSWHPSPSTSNHYHLIQPQADQQYYSSTSASFLSASPSSSSKHSQQRNNNKEVHLLFGDRFIPLRKYLKFGQLSMSPKNNKTQHFFMQFINKFQQKANMLKQQDKATNQKYANPSYKQQQFIMDYLERPKKIRNHKILKFKHSSNRQRPSQLLQPHQYLSHRLETCSSPFSNNAHLCSKELEVQGEVVDNFYTDVLDSTNKQNEDDLVGIAHPESVSIYNLRSNESILVQLKNKQNQPYLTEEEEIDFFTSFAFENQPSTTTSKALLGSNRGSLQLLDLNLQKIISQSKIDHDYSCPMTIQVSTNNRIGCLQCSPFNPHLFASGARTGSLDLIDIRMAQAQITYKNVNFKNSAQSSSEICIVKFDPLQENRLCLGRTDHTLQVVDLIMNMNNMNIKIEEAQNSAIRALSWSKVQRGIIFSGGGHFDQTIKQWDIGKLQANENPLVQTMQVNGQVCCVETLEEQGVDGGGNACNYIISSHGLPNNDIVMRQVGSKKEFQQHSQNCSFLSNQSSDFDFDFENENVNEDRQIHYNNYNYNNNNYRIGMHAKRVLHMKLCSSGNKACTLSSDKMLKIWNLRRFSDYQTINYQEKQDTLYNGQRSIR